MSVHKLSDGLCQTGNTAREIWKIMGQEEGNKTNIVCEKTR